MRLIRLEIHNFLSIESAVLEYKPGLYFVEGKNYDMSDGSESNGTGKSALCGEAVEWVLWGTLSRIPGKSGKPIADSVINSNVGKDCYGSIEFDYNGNIWKIIRTRKHTKFGNSISWFVNGQNKSKHDSSETQKDLEEALPLSHDVFRHAVQIGQGFSCRFLSLTETEKQNLLCDILNLRIYDDALEVTKNNITIWETKSSSLKSYIDDTTSQIQFREQESNSITYEILTIEKDISSLCKNPINDSLNGLRSSNTSLEHNLETNRKSFDECIKNRETVMEEYKEIISKSHSCILEVEGKKQSFVSSSNRNLFSIESNIRSWDQRISVINKEIKDLEVQKQSIIQSEKCEYCGSKLSDPIKINKRVKEIESLTSEKRKELDSSRSSRDIVFMSFEDYKKKVVDASKEWDLYISSIRETEKGKTASINELISSINQRIVELDLERDSLLERIKTNKKKIGELESSLGKIIERENSLKIHKARLEEKLSILHTSIRDDKKSIERSVDIIKDQDKIIDHWKYWKQSIPNLRASAMEQVLRYLNSRISEYLNIFSSGIMGMEMFQEARGKGSRVKVDLRTSGGTYEMSSGGERRRVDLAIYLALSDLVFAASGVSCTFLIADEIMDGLSPEGVKKFAEILKIKSEQGMCVFVISHNPSVRQMVDFDEVICLERRGGKANISGIKVEEEEWNMALAT